MSVTWWMCDDVESQCFRNQPQWGNCGAAAIGLRQGSRFTVVASTISAASFFLHVGKMIIQYLIVEISPTISVQTSQTAFTGSTQWLGFFHWGVLHSGTLPVELEKRISAYRAEYSWLQFANALINDRLCTLVENVIRTTVRIFVIWELRLVSLLHLTPRCRRPLISAYDPLAGSPFEVAEPKPQLALIQNTWY